MKQPFDLYAVASRREELLALACTDRFADWWAGLVDHGRLEELAFVAALTGDEALGARCAEGVDKLLTDDQPWMSPAHRFHYPELNADLLVAEQSKSLAATLSWARPHLGEERYAAGLTALHDRGGAVIFADAERGAWWSDGYNSNWTAVLNSGLGVAALACSERYPDEAAAWLSRAKRVALTMLDLAGDEGAGIEGLSYWVYLFRSLLDLAEALRCAGDDELSRHPVWTRAAEFALYLSQPDLSGWVNFGDCGHPGLGGSHLFAALASRGGDGRAQWLAERVAGRSIHDLLYYDPTVPATPPDGLPPCRLFPSVQLAVLRSDWSADAVQMVVKGGSNAWSHCHLDLASFVLTACGERLAVDPGPWPYTDDYWTSVEPPVSTAWHNTLTVDGGDQRQPPRYRLSYDLEESGDAWCRLGGFVDGPDHAEVFADATAAYADTLEQFVRHVTYEKPNVFVVRDEITLRQVRAQRHLQWLLHAVAPIELTDTGAIVRGERAELRVTVEAPAGWRGKLLPDRQAKGDQPLHCWALRPPWHHLWNVSPSRSPYPQWDPRGGTELFGREVVFEVRLEVVRRG